MRTDAIRADERRRRRARLPQPAPDLPNEEWRPILGGVYEVSSFGRVRTAIWRKSSRKGRVLRPYVNNWGYAHAQMCINGKKITVPIHRLVATAFIRPPTPGEVTNHIDGNKVNNRRENLEWVTEAGNVQHAIDTGLTPKPPPQRGSAHHKSHLTDEQVREIRALKGQCLQRAVAAKYGISEVNVSHIQCGRTWKHLP